MRVLYLHPTRDAVPPPEGLMRRGYEVVPVTALPDALALIRTEHFDAVVIAEEIEDPGIIDFTADVHRSKPELPVFLLNDWNSDLLAALESLGARENSDEGVN
jgi:DNA-binding NtrC family response regulator